METCSNLSFPAFVQPGKLCYIEYKEILYKASSLNNEKTKFWCGGIGFIVHVHKFSVFR